MVFNNLSNSRLLLLSFIAYLVYRYKRVFNFLIECVIFKNNKSERLFNGLRKNLLKDNNNQSPVSERRVCIIGSGMSGILAAIKLKKAQIPFVIYERAHDIGGTWLFNTYPGCGCDVMSHAYSYSFELNPEWSRVWAKRDEIQKYFLNVVEKYNLRENIQFNTEVIAAVFYKDQSSWEITTRKIVGDPYIVQDNPVTQRLTNASTSLKSDISISKFNILIGATGQLNNPYIPENIKGIENFKGPQFHTARWNSSVDITNKDVIFVGTGASAIQIVPEIVDKVKSLTLLQRSPGWIVEKDDYEYSSLAKWIFDNVPFALKLYRLYFFMWMDSCYYSIIASKEPTFSQKMVLSLLLKQQNDSFKSRPELGDIVTPKERFGCKRLLISSDWYPALMKNNVKVIPEAVSNVVEDGVVTAKTKTNLKGDVIIWATGFKTDKWLPGIHVEVKDSKESVGGVVLSEVWSKEAPAAYLGVTLPHFPNLFLLYGPNTNLNHSSIIFQSECETEHMMRILYEMERNGYKQVKVREDKFMAYNNELQNNLEDTAFSSDCNSWYRHNGKITNNWYGTCWDYWNAVNDDVIQSSYQFDSQGNNPKKP